MVEEVKVTRNYQVTIPAAARAKLDVKVGDVLVADFQDRKIIFEKKSSDITKLHIKLKRKIDWKDVEKIVRDAGNDIGEGRS
jgi:antitoxin PrlF